MKLWPFIPALALALAGNLSESKSATSHTCGKDFASGVEYKWCVDLPPDPNSDVLYYLHGGGGDENSWTSAVDNRAITSEWNVARARTPNVITISFGANWLLTEIAKKNEPALFPIFTNEIMPALESKIGHTVSRRILKGESMGGFNASMLWLKRPDLFSRVALVCPGISTIGPYTSSSDIKEFLDRNKPYIDLVRVNELIEWTKWEFPIQQNWIDHNPLDLIQKKNYRASELYISCGEQDEYGFFEGAAQFSKLAAGAGATVNWDPLTGGHCVSNPKAIADFLVN